MNKKLKWLLISIIVILLIICCTLAVLLIIKNNKRIIKSPVILEEPKEEIAEVIYKNQYFTVKGCISKYFLHCSMLNSLDDNKAAEAETKNNRQRIAKIIYNMLDKDYIKYKGITEENILNIIPNTKDAVIYIDSMYLSEKHNNVKVYLVNGTLREKQSGNLSKFNMIVKLDYNNETFSIILDDFVREKYTNIKLGENIQIGDDSIEPNDNNGYVFKKLTEQNYVDELFNDFKDKCLYDLESIYAKLDEEYKKVKFSNTTELKEFIKNRYDNLNSLYLVSYSKEERDGYTEYTLIDSEYNCFIIRETAAMKYTILLDIYSIELPEHAQNYEYTNVQGKVALNLDKILSALNGHDYKYIYDKLADSFKTKNFKTYEAFEKYAKENFYNKNTFKYVEFNKEGEEYYTYLTKIGNLKRINDPIIEKTFIMQLRRRERF